MDVCAMSGWLGGDMLQVENTSWWCIPLLPSLEVSMSCWTIVLSRKKQHIDHFLVPYILNIVSGKLAALLGHLNQKVGSFRGSIE